MKILFGVILYLLAGSVFAAVPTDHALDEIVIAYKTASASWEPAIKTYAYRLFWLLVAIDWAWGAMKLATQNSEFDSVIGFVVNKIMVIGFFLALLTFSSGWATTIVDSLRSLAGIAGGTTSITPSNVMDLGLNVAVGLLDDLSVLDLGTTIIAGLIAIVILIIFALITAELIFVLVTLWIILYAGVIMLAFGGSSWTQSYALNYFKTILAIAVKLFVIQLLIGIGTAILSNWATLLSDDPSFEEMGVIAAGVIVLYALVKGIGGLVESLITGHGAASTSGSGAITSAMTATGAMMAGAAGYGAAAMQSTYGAGQAISAASQLAKAEGATGGMGMATATMGNLAKSFGQDYSNKAAGDISTQHGATGSRMASAMRDQAAEASMKGQSGDSASENGNYISGVDSDVSDNSDKQQ